MFLEPQLSVIYIYTVTFSIDNTNNSYHCVIFTPPESDCESSGSTLSSAVASVGGVLAAVTVTAIVVLVIVIVVLMRKLNRAETYTTAQPLER